MAPRWRELFDGNFAEMLVREDLGPCLCWTGRRTPYGHGVVSLPVALRHAVGAPERKAWSAHRLVWTLTHGPIPAGRWVLHNCDVPPCVRHLRLGTPLEKTRDMIDRGRDDFGGVRHTAWNLRLVRRLKRRARLAGPKCSEELAATIRRYAAEHVAQKDLAAVYGLSVSMVSRIVRGERWPASGHDMEDQP